MRKFSRPKIVVSKCLGFAACRWNGVAIDDDFVDLLKKYVDFIPVCAEFEIGLGVPREPVRVVRTKGEFKLVQPSTGLDCTEKMEAFAGKYMNGLSDIDGFLLKSRSPSCGIKDVKLYGSAEKGAAIGKATGFFAIEAMRAFPLTAFEDEARLNDYRIREHYLRTIFAFAAFRDMKAQKTMSALVKFHSENKLLIMSQGQTHLKMLGKIVANHEKLGIEKVLDAYCQVFFKAFMNPAKFSSNINVLMHALGYFSKELGSKEKKYFLETLERYRDGRVPLSVPLEIIRSFVVRFNEPYLSSQTFFEPYPEKLMLVTDSGKGRMR